MIIMNSLSNIIPSSTSSLHLFGLETDLGPVGWATGETTDCIDAIMYLWF